MALPTGILSRTGLGTARVVREDLADIIYNISPTECPVVSAIGRNTADQDAHEWVTDALAAARSDNKHVDGDDFAAEGAAGQVGSGFIGVALTAGSRIGNHCQISRKDLVVSGRSQVVKKAGRSNELGYQIAKAGRELKRDMETAILANNNAVSGNDTTAGQAASINAWMRNANATSRGATGADPAALVSGFPTGTAATDGTQRAMSETDLLAVIGEIYIAGGDPDTAVMHPLLKQKWSQYMFSPSTTDAGRIATQYQDQGKSPSGGATALGAVDVYVSDFGKITIVPDRFARNREVTVLETDMWAVSYLRSFQQFDLAKSGDSEKRVLLCDWTLEARNPDSAGIMADLNPASAMVFASTQT
jgi:hypothetical protein